MSLQLKQHAPTNAVSVTCSYEQAIAHARKEASRFEREYATVVLVAQAGLISRIYGHPLYYVTEHLFIL